MIENTISTDSGEGAEAVAEAAAENGLLRPHNNETEQQDIYAKTADAAENGSTGTEEYMSAEQEKADTDTEKPSEETVELTLYGEKIQLSKSQAIAAAQKGMAFEHIKGQLSAAKNDVRLKTLADIAAMKGQTIADFIGEMQHRAVADEITARYGSFENAPAEVLSEAVRMLEHNRLALQQREAEAKRHDASFQLMEFLENNPGCREIPQEVVDRANKGESMSLAYSRFNENRLAKELSDAKRELEILKSEEKARRSSTPTAMNSGAANESKENEFLKLMKSTW